MTEVVDNNPIECKDILNEKDEETTHANREFLPQEAKLLDETKEYSKEFMDNFFNEVVRTVDADGVPYSFYPVRDALCKEGPAAMPILFEWYNENNQQFDPWINFLLTLSHFSEQEMGLKPNRATRKALELKVKKLMKKQAEQPKKHAYQIIRENINNL
jgi:hypothetical protein